MTDYRALCIELIEKWQNGKDYVTVINRISKALVSDQNTDCLQQEHVDKLLAELDTPEKAREFLIQAGLVDEYGELTEHYRNT